MSVPLPSPSSLPPAKTVTRSRPTPIAVGSGDTKGSASPHIQGSVSPSSSSFRRPFIGSHTGRSSAFDSTGGANGHGSGEDNWRSRGTAGESVPKSIAAVVITGNGQAPTGATRGPERTVGGFEKREIRSPTLGQSALSGAKDKESKTAALSHVPCRFFKAGACTAGATCPFSHEAGGKRETCQWFLKGECKFGHKCALAHVRPGEPMSMDRKNKKDQQREARERVEGHDLATSPVAGSQPSPIPTPITHPVPIRSAISTSLQSGSLHSLAGRLASSPLREPYGPPSAIVAGSPSAGFNQSRPTSGPPPPVGSLGASFASSPSRPSPLSTSFNARASVPGPLSLKSNATVSMHSPLRPPPSAGPAIFSSSFSHTSMAVDKSGPPLSASFADGTLRRSIWARSETPDEPLSPARRPIPPRAHLIDDVFDEQVDDHGEDLLPSSLSDLLTPTERARRMSRRDSQDSYAGSPSRAAFIHAAAHQNWIGAERLAQSAGAALPPSGFLQALWSQDGGDARKDSSPSPTAAPAELSFAQAKPQPPRRQSLLTQQRAPSSSAYVAIRDPVAPAVDAPYLMRDLLADPSSPTARALQEHAPGQSLPGGLAAALSRMHMQPRAPSILGGLSPQPDLVSPPSGTVPLPGSSRREDHEEEALFHMEG